MSKKIGTPVENPLWSQVKVAESRIKVENMNAKAGVEGLTHKDEDCVVFDRQGVLEAAVSNFM
jgi:hypothetical protein